MHQLTKAIETVQAVLHLTKPLLLELLLFIWAVVELSKFAWAVVFGQS